MKQVTDENTTIRFTEQAQGILQKLKAAGVIGEMRDGYRLGIALAVATGTIAAPGLKMRTFLNIGSFDSEGVIRNVIGELYPDEPGTPYEIAERLAEAGVSELGRLYDSQQLRFTDVLSVAPRTDGAP